MGCYEGIDQSGRSAGALYDAAVEGLAEAQTAAQREIAKRAMKDAFNPAMSNQRAVACNKSLDAAHSFSACVAGDGPEPGLKMTIPCQMNLDDGRVLVDGQALPAGAKYTISHYNPASVASGWSRGYCDIVFIK